MQEEYKKALERITILEKEIARIKQVILALSEGQPINESMGFDAGVFLEENIIWRKSFSKLAHVMDRLMEIKYCTYDSVVEDLERECEEYREKVRMYTGWGLHIADPFLIERLEEELQDIYEYGIYWYERSAREHPDLRDMAGLLPEKCPWTLEELMESEGYELLDKLPKREAGR